MSKGHRVPRHEALSLAHEFLDITHYAWEAAVVCGSIRRRKATVGDLDIVVAPINEMALREACINMFKRDTKVGNYKGIDIQLTPCIQFDMGAALLYATGSGEFNMYMRGVAKAKGLLLNRSGLWNRDKSKLVASSTEEAIFEALRLNFIEPEFRDEYYKSSWTRV
jgi:DNA polymerase (family 10)